MPGEVLACSAPRFAAQRYARLAREIRKRVALSETRLLKQVDYRHALVETVFEE